MELPFILLATQPQSVERVVERDEPTTESTSTCSTATGYPSSAVATKITEIRRETTDDD